MVLSASAMRVAPIRNRGATILTSGSIGRDSGIARPSSPIPELPLPELLPSVVIQLIVASHCPSTPLLIATAHRRPSTPLHRHHTNNKTHVFGTYFAHRTRQTSPYHREYCLTPSSKLLCKGNSRRRVVQSSESWRSCTGATSTAEGFAYRRMVYGRGGCTGDCKLGGVCQGSWG
jgi:hypothetical protein